MNEIPTTLLEYKIPKKERTKCLWLLSFFRIDEERADKKITENQLKIFHSLIFRPWTRVIILCSTQYGKSLITALACVIITTIQGEVVSIVAPTNDKARIIMRYYIEHLGDHYLFYSQLEADTRMERLKQEGSKERIILRNGGGIFIVSVQSGNTRKTLEAAMGYGSKIVISDESCLIPDETEATIFRMIAGKGKDAFYCKIGNPFYKTPPHTHFFKSWNDDNYLKIFIDYEQGIKEGRYTQGFIDEARTKPHFDVLFECKFPEEEIMEGKWLQLLTIAEIERAMEGTEELEIFGEKAFGADPASTGLNESLIVVRGANLAEIRFASNKITPIEFMGHCLRTIKDDKIKSSDIFLDGIGNNLADLIRQQGQSVNAVNVAEKAIDQRNFINKRAESYWRAREWVKSGGKLKADERWMQLAQVFYKAQDSTGRMQIMSKDIMASKGIPSPDAGDALMLTFTDPIKVFSPSYEQKHFDMKMKQKNLKKRGIRSRV